MFRNHIAGSSTESFSYLPCGLECQCGFRAWGLTHHPRDPHAGGRWYQHLAPHWHSESGKAPVVLGTEQAAQDARGRPRGRALRVALPLPFREVNVPAPCFAQGVSPFTPVPPHRGSAGPGKLYFLLRQRFFLVPRW